MENSIWKRRQFLQASGLAGVGLLFGAKEAVSNPASANVSMNSSSSAKRVLGSGKHSLEVSSIGLGCMGMSYHRSFIPDRKAMIKMIRQTADSGVNLFDTAEAYGPITNEDLVGEALQPIRKDILIATKFGF